MLRAFWLMILGFVALIAGPSPAADDPEDNRKVLAGELAGVYRFDYLFSEGGISYVDISGHLQFLELDQDGNAPRVTFYNQTGKGERRSHYSYVFYLKEGKLILREFDGGGRIPFRLHRNFSP